MRSKKGDFLLTIDPQWCHGADLRVVIEAKNRSLSWREIREELDEAKRNRGAAMALAIFSPGARAGRHRAVRRPLRPRLLRRGPGRTGPGRRSRPRSGWPGCTPWPRSPSDEDDRRRCARVLATVAAIKTELEALRGLKTQLTSIRSTATEVSRRARPAARRRSWRASRMRRRSSQAASSCRSPSAELPSRLRQERAGCGRPRASATGS